MIAAGAPAASVPPFIARWDLDKTYLRTDFDTVRDLVRTAVERPDLKRTVPGAARFMRELCAVGAEVHILSGSPEQLRSRLTAKLRLDGVRWASLTLKPNLQNILRLRFRALRGQLGYKLPALLSRRAEERWQRLADGSLVPEVLLGDDAEADAYVYSLYADVLEGRVDEDTLRSVMRAGGAYDDTIEDAVRYARYVEQGHVVRRVLIHLDRQSSPSDFAPYGARVVPIYNYMQAAFVLEEEGLLPAEGALRVAEELVRLHNFDGRGLARSHADLVRRGHLRGDGVARLSEARRSQGARPGWSGELAVLVDELERAPRVATPPTRALPPLDYVALASSHNRRRKKA